MKIDETHISQVAQDVCAERLKIWRPQRTRPKADRLIWLWSESQELQRLEKTANK